MLAPRHTPVRPLADAAVIDALPVGVAILDRRGCITRVNLTLARLLQASRDRLVGHPLADVLPIDQGALAEALDTCALFGEAELPNVATGEATFALHVGVATGDPEERALVTFTPSCAEEPPVVLAELVRTALGQGRPLEARLRALLEAPHTDGPTLRESIQRALDPDVREPYRPEDEVRAALDRAGTPATLELADPLPGSCLGDRTNLRTALGALLTDLRPHHQRPRLHVIHHADTEQLRFWVSPLPAPEPTPLVAAVAAAYDIDLVAGPEGWAVAVPAQAAAHAHAHAGAETRRLLLVEDDPVSALIARGHLEHHGMVVEHVSTGREAIARARAQHYPLVVLDCMLPDLDGREVFDQLVALPPHRRPDRIIATSGMSSGALPGGMADAPVDAVVPKPIQGHTLRAALGRDRSPAPAAGIGSSPDVPVLDADTITALHAMVGSTAMVNRVLNDFIDDLGTSHTALARAVGQGDIDAVRRTAHRLKGAAATVGALRIEALARGLEDGAKQGDLAIVAPAVVRLDMEARSVQRALADLFV